MKWNIVISLFLVLPVLTFGQSVNFEDDFSDLDISNWQGQRSHFIFFQDDDNILLQLNADSSGRSYLSIPSTNITGVWEFFIRLDFSPSNNNQAFIYLMSDRADLTGPINGYALQAGENLSGDVFRLFKISDGEKDGEILAGTTKISSGGDYRVKITRTSSGNWTLEVGSGYAGILNVEASAVNNDYSSASHFGLLAKYTQSNRDNFAFDFKIDVPPIEINSVTVTDRFTLDVAFSRNIDFSSALNSDFRVSPGNITPNNLTLLAPDTIRIHFENPLLSGINNLAISDIRDETNETVLSDTLFTFTLFDASEAGDVIINEFMKDPPDGATEYVELKNTSPKYLNLQNWELGDNNSLNVISDEDLLLPPNGFIVFSSDTALMNNYFGEGSYIQTSLPSFNNGGDQIRLFNADDVLADSLEYTSVWGGVKVALERRSISAPAFFVENWEESGHPTGGTPGFENEVSQDITAPSISNLILIDEKSLLISFSERVIEEVVEDFSNYELEVISPDIFSAPQIQSLTQIAKDSVYITLQYPLEEESFQLTVSNLTDIFGNIRSSDSIEFEYKELSETQFGDLFINEFMYDPPDEYSEFIEIYNPSDKNFNLQNWTLNDNASTRRTLTSEKLILERNSYLVLIPDSTLIEKFPGLPFLIPESFPSLNNSSDAIVIRNPSGELIDSLAYSAVWGGEEVSLERRSTEVLAIYKENWGNSPSPDSTTAGLPNLVEQDLGPPEIQSFEIYNDNTIKFIFSERIDAGPAVKPSNFTIRITTGPQTVTYNDDHIQLEYTEPDTLFLFYEPGFISSLAGITYEIDIENQEDIFGNVNLLQQISFEQILTDTARFGDIHINEFMYDPAEEFPEFIELANFTSSNFDLKDWTINDNSGSQKLITDSSYIFRSLNNSGGYLVLTGDSTFIELFPEVPAIVVKSFPSLNNGSDAITLRNQNGAILDSLFYTQDWGGNEVSLERRSTEVPAIYKENWGSSPSADSATAGLPNLIEDDLISPEIQFYELQNDNTLQFIFSERIKPAPAINLSNFKITITSGQHTEVSDNNQMLLEYVEPDTVLLFYEPGFNASFSGIRYQIDISNQEDIFGNVNPLQQFSFEQTLTETAEFNDIQINEFMYDPAGGFPEFIELANFTSSNFNLKKWTINDDAGARRSISDSSYIFRSQNYLVLTGDSSFIELFPEAPVILMPSLPSLNNSSDAIVLRNQDGELIDSLFYSSDWGGENISLERRSSEALAIYEENWGESPSPDHTTPGKENQIEPDTEPPVFDLASATGQTSITLNFNETLNSTPALESDNYSISPTISISNVQYSGKQVKLTLSFSMADQTTYSITIKNQKDIFGNMMKPVTTEVRYLRFSEAQYNEVVINEILYRRVDEASPEFIELYNPTTSSFDLSSWTLSDAGNSSATFPEGISLAPDEFLILTDRKDFSAATDHAVYLNDFPTLNDSGDAIIIRNRNEKIIDSLFYRDVWGGDNPGFSLERKDPFAASNDDSNWASNNTSSGHSAGTKNSAFEPDQTAPDAIFANLQNSSIFVAFSEFVQLTPETRFNAFGETVQVISFDSTQANTLLLSNPSSLGSEPDLQINNLRDIRGNATENLTIPISRPVTPGAVTINEIMFDPMANPDDNLPDQTEYIELYNRAEYPVSLEGFFLHDAPDETKEIRQIYPVSSEYRWIPSYGYFLIYSEDQSNNFEESKTAKYFDLAGLDERFTIQVNRSSLSLGSSGDAIFLADSTGTVIDSVFYDESWQNPNLYSTDGLALERINPNGPANDKTNWSSSTDIRGGTPGEQNAIFQKAGEGPQNTGITFTPNPFSPDEDGFEDHLFINYKLNEADYLLRIRIFDRYGRHVRKLADSKPAGFEGSVLWDGLTDERHSNRVGIYIVLFEAFNSATGKDVTFKEAVVLARKF